MSKLREWMHPIFNNKKPELYYEVDYADLFYKYIVIGLFILIPLIIMMVIIV